MTCWRTYLAMHCSVYLSVYLVFTVYVQDFLPGNILSELLENIWDDVLGNICQVNNLGVYLGTYLPNISTYCVHTGNGLSDPQYHRKNQTSSCAVLGVDVVFYYVYIGYLPGYLRLCIYWPLLGYL